MGEIRFVGTGETRGYPYPVCKKYFVDMKLLFDKNLTRLARIILFEFCRILLKIYIGQITENQQFSSHPKCLNYIVT